MQTNHEVQFLINQILQNKIFQSLERKRKIAPDLLLDLAARKLIRI